MCEQTRQLTVVGPSRTVAAASAVGLPALIADAGEHATRGFPEFFAATMCNKNTRVAYLHAVDRFFTWCERHRIGDLADIEPLRVAAYIEALEKQLREANRQAAPGRDPYAVEPQVNAAATLSAHLS